MRIGLFTLCLVLSAFMTGAMGFSFITELVMTPYQAVLLVFFLGASVLFFNHKTMFHYSSTNWLMLMLIGLVAAMEFLVPESQIMIPLFVISVYSLYWYLRCVMTFGGDIKYLI